jgi:hypothetical protein
MTTAVGWATSVALTALYIGINVLVHLDQPREILQFVGGYLVVYGSVGLAILAWYYLWKVPRL